MAVGQERLAVVIERLELVLLEATEKMQGQRVYSITLVYRAASLIEGRWDFPLVDRKSVV